MDLSCARMSTILNLSTGHLTADVAQEMTVRGDSQWHQQLIFIENGDYGFFVHVPGRRNRSDENLTALPNCLRACIEVAQRLNADWILFDRDEDPIEALPFYSW